MFKNSTRFVVAALLLVSSAGPAAGQPVTPAAGCQTNAIDEGMFVDVNGSAQWITVRGCDRRNPVLLWLHGGPGIAMSGQAPLFFAWERYFTIVQWDQPGGGATLARNGLAGTGDLSIARYVRDAEAVAEWATGHLATEKLIVMGTSWGTLLGLHLAARRPDLVAAYVGTGQFVDGPRGARYGYDTALRDARLRSDSAAVAELETVGPPPYSRFEDFLVRQKYVNPPAQVPSALDAAAMADAAKLLSQPPSPDARYLARNLPEIGAVEGFLNTQRAVFAETAAFDADTLGTEFKVPMFFFQGADDLNTPTALVREYVARIKAPVKRLEILPDVGHLIVVHHDRLLQLLNEYVRPLVSEAPAPIQGSVTAAD